MFDLKVINSVLDQLEEERGISRERVIEAIETSLATAYKKEYGKRGQIVRASFDLGTGATEFYQVKIVVTPEAVKMPEEVEAEREEREATLAAGEEIPAVDEDNRVRYNPEQHILLADAKLMKADATEDDEIVFPLETRSDFGRIAAQTAKQVIIQKIREAEKTSILGEYEDREGEIISGTVQRIERGNVFLDLGRATAILPFDEQIPGERFRQGERLQAYLYNVEEGARGVFLRVSRSHPRFLQKLFEYETPELTSGTVEIKGIAREPGSRSKLAVHAADEHIDPVGALVGQRGVRVSTVMSALGGEKIDVIEWAEDPAQFIEDALSPAKVLDVELNEDEHRAIVEVTEDQQSLAIGKGGQNVRLAAKLTGWKIDIHSVAGDSIAETDGEEVDIAPDDPHDEAAEAAQEEAAEEDTLADEAPDSGETPEETDETFTEATEELTEEAANSLAPEHDGGEPTAETSAEADEEEKNG
ncbi:transcription termination/antitermination protein NusA [Patescibacteria group bacterium]|jgi:N utilization substance protein A|nr:transcription termination/antitermination protein NusA [Patescibacteria group bacterium]